MRHSKFYYHLKNTNKKSLLGPWVRTIYTDSLKAYFDNHPRNNVLIVGGLAAVSALNSRVLKNPQFANRITLASEMPWIGNTDAAWEKAPWGQNVNYLPEFLRDIATKQLGLPLSHDLNFGEMKIITRQAYEFGKENYQFIDQRLQKVIQTTNEAHILTATNSDLCIPSNMVFNFARIPNSHFKGIPVNSAGELYTLAPNYIYTPICIDGMGQNAIWILRDLAGKCPIWIMISHDEKLRPDLKEKIQAINSAIEDPNLKCGIMRLKNHFHPEINHEKNIISFQGKNLLDKSFMTVDIPLRNVFGARGFKTDSHLVTGKCKVDKHHPSFAGVKLISIVPQGNLAALHTGIESFFGSDIINNYRDLGRMDLWKERVNYHANAQGLEIDRDFFDILEIQYAHASANTIHHMWKLEIMVEKAFKGHVRMKQKDHKGEPIDLSWREFLIQINQKPVQNKEHNESPKHHESKKFKNRY